MSEFSPARYCALPGLAFAGDQRRSSQPLGIDLHHWLHCSRIDRLPLGRRAAASVGVLDAGQCTAALAAGRPGPRDMSTTSTADGVRWPDGSNERVDAVILGTGYRPSLGVLPPEAYEPGGRPARRRGTSTTVPGVSCVGPHVARQLQRRRSTAHHVRATVPVRGGHG